MRGITFSAALVGAALGCGPQRPHPGTIARSPGEPAVVQVALPTPPTRPTASFEDPSRLPRLLIALPAVSARVARVLEEHPVPSVAAGVVIDGTLVWSRAWGVRDVRSGEPVRADSVFRIGSITKVLTAMAILKLRDDGRLELDRPAYSYLPALARVATAAGDARAPTIRELLTHTSGLPRLGEYNYANPDHVVTREELLGSLDGFGSLHAPGEAHVYSNLGYQLLGHVVEEVSGVAYTDYVRREVLAPLGMKRATWRDVPAGRIATPHAIEHGRAVAKRPWAPSATAASGGLWASVPDLAELAALHLAAWPPRDGPEHTVLARATLREMHDGARPVALRASVGDDGSVDAHAAAQALGWQVRLDCRLGRVVWHNGGTEGHRAALYLLPDHGVAVILLANLAGAPLDDAARDMLAIFERYGGLSPRRHRPAPSLDEAATTWADLLRTWDDRRLRERFAPPFFGEDTEEDVLRLRRSLAETARLVGACEPPREREAGQPLGGTYELDCDRGLLELRIAVAPARLARIASASVRIFGVPATAQVTNAARDVIALFDAWDPVRFERRFAPSWSKTAMKTLFARTAKRRGKCTIGDTIESWPFGAALRLHCEHGDTTLRLGLDDGGSEQIVEMTIAADPPPGSRCPR